MCSVCPRRCKKPCQWSCPHHTCLLDCDEPCTRPKCDARCTKTLERCGHQCFGLCGETCPPLCPTCYCGENGEEEEAWQKKVAERVYVDNYIIFENDLEEYCSGKIQEEAPDDVANRIAQMPCCKYLITIGFLDQNIKAWNEEQESGKIGLGLPRCPLCSTPFGPTTVRRYSYLVKTSCKDLPQIYDLQRKQLKEITEQNRRAITRATNVLLFGVEVEDEKLDQPNENLEEYWDHMEKRKDVELLGDMNKLQEWKSRLMDLKKPVEMEMTKRNWRLKSHTDFKLLMTWCMTVEPVLPSVYATAAAFLNFVQLRPLQQNAAQVIADIHATLHSYCQYLLRNHFLEERVAKQFALTVEWLGCLFTVMVNDTNRGRAMMTLKHKAFFQRLYLPSAEKYAQLSVDLKKLEEMVVTLGRPSQEKFNRNFLRGISKALGLSAGQWFRCPEGHMYAIGECGGAMQRSRCPECGAVIGGEQHAVVKTNQFAGGILEDQATPKYPQGHLNMM